MRLPGARGTDSERGQASVEFLGALPAALLVVAIGWQLVVAAHTLWLAGNAARVGARAEGVGRDPLAAARSALPRGLREGLEVRRGAAGRVSVRLPVPLLVYRWRLPLEVGASAATDGGER
jgi:pilus assembly protein CpaE